jgi:hypothetical protein
MLNNGRNHLLRWLWQASSSGPTLMELFLALSALRWAVYLILPPGALDNNMSDTMWLMFDIAPVWLWATAFALLGLAQGAAALGVNTRLRSLIAFAGMIWWLAVVGLDVSINLTAGTLNVCTFALAEWAVFMLYVVVYDEEN